jgi:DNA polymerase-1
MAFLPLFSGSTPSLELTGLAVAVTDRAVLLTPSTPGWSDLLHVLTVPTPGKATHDAKLATNLCMAAGLTLSGLTFDSLVAGYLLDPAATRYSLPDLAAAYLSRPAQWEEAKLRQDPRYAAWAVGIVRDLRPVLEERIEAAGLQALYCSIELPLARVLSAMEMNGVAIDAGSLMSMSGELAVRIEQLLREIYTIAGEEFNVNSTKQLGVILYEKLGLPILKKTKTGYSTDAEVLEKLSGQHIIIDNLLEYRMLAKLKSTYLDGMNALISSTTGRIHTTFNQTVTTTGRLSSSEPNLQNIPVRTESGRRIREMFVPGAGWDYILSADYSQIELRVLAHMSGDENLIDAFRHGQDIHTRTAAEVFGVPLDEVTGLLRSRAKAVNFGIVYGISDFGLSRDIGVSRKEAEQYIVNYFARYPGVKQFMDRSVADARKLGFVTTLFGRRRYLPDINASNFSLRSFAERTAMNTPIQGTAADIIKKAMVIVYDRLISGGFKSRILLQVHDELLLEVVAGEADVVSRIVREAMEQAAELSVPLVTDVKLGKSWAAAK